MAVTLMEPSAAHEQMFSEAFKKHDTDNDGYLQKKEFKAVLRSLGIPMTDSSIKKVFAEVDISGDNRVSREEFLLSCKGPLLEHLEEWLATFEVFDLNSNGYIAKKEIATIMERLAVEMTEEEIDEIIEHCDQDDDGMISYKEFLDANLGSASLFQQGIP